MLHLIPILVKKRKFRGNIEEIIDILALDLNKEPKIEYVARLKKIRVVIEGLY